jgi:hypothetical protein
MTRAKDISKILTDANLSGDITASSFNGGQLGGRRNLIINGAMKVAQRATSVTGIGGSNGYFTVDRFNIGKGDTAGRLTMTQTADGPSGFANCIKLDCTTADTSVAAGELLWLEQKIEGQDLQQFKKGTSDAEQYSVSFYVKGNANATYALALTDNDNSRHIVKLFSVTTAWTRITMTFPADTTGAFGDDNAHSLSVKIWLHAGSTYTSGTLQSSAWASITAANRAAGITSFFDSTDRTFFLTGLQLEVGSVATPFEHRSYGEELALCQRYYFQKINGDGQPVGIGTYISSGQIRTYIDFPVEMRADPSIVTSSGTAHFNIENPSDDFDGGWVIVQINKTSAVPYATGSVSGTTSYSGIIRSKSADSRLAFNSEL